MGMLARIRRVTDGGCDDAVAVAVAKLKRVCLRATYRIDRPVPMYRQQHDRSAEQTRRPTDCLAHSEVAEALDAAGARFPRPFRRSGRRCPGCGF